jgi:hypothetical protein
MPLTRPDVISDGVSLSDKDRRKVRAFVAEERAADPFLRRLGVVDEFAPNEPCAWLGSPQNNEFSRSAELLALPIWSAAVVPLVEGEH